MVFGTDHCFKCQRHCPPLSSRPLMKRFPESMWKLGNGHVNNTAFGETYGGKSPQKSPKKNTKHPRICKMRGVVLCQHLGTQSMPLELHRHLVDMMPQMSLKRTPTLIPRHNTEEYLNRCPKMKNPVTECFLTQARHL